MLTRLSRFSFAALATLFLATASCATTFTGDAHVSGGPAGCEAKCRGWGLEFEGMVAMGDYSDACVCKRPGATSFLVDSHGGAAGAAVGVIMQSQSNDDNGAGVHLGRHLTIGF